MYALGPGFNYAYSDHSARLRPPKNPPSEQIDSTIALASKSSSASGRDLITYIFPDFRAVKYFQKEFISTNEFHLVEESESTGFEIYFVDQWISSRKIGTVVAAFTGNTETQVKVIKFTVIRKPIKQYPQRFQEYLNEIMLNHATFKKMNSVQGQEGTGSTEINSISELLFVTNISALPSSLNLIPISDGDTRPVEGIFMINSNLRKLSCGGRSMSLIADKVSDASEDKFRQMYKVYNEAVPIKFAIKELVNLIQTCLFYFDLLDARYCDGLLCKKTEDAISNWWNLIGLPHFNIKPNPKNGILPAKTVAAIISLTLSVKMRLQLFGGCDVPKDPFDFENFMISIGQFQKQVKIDKRRKLDLLTLLKLFYLTNQKHSADSTKQHSGFGTDSYFDDADQSIFDSSSILPMPYSSNNLANLSTSTYKRNKLYYSKELKKLTNVVKNTVQDHIIVREDDDGFFTDPLANASSGRIRSKLASKLADNLTPTEVETIDLELLVRRFLLGKTLARLWQGLTPTPNLLPGGTKDESPLSLNHHHHRHHHHNQSHGLHFRSDSSDKNADRYQFVSLRDAITMNQEISSAQGGDRSGRLGRMRFAFQARKGNSYQSKLDIFSNITQDSLGKSSSNDGYLADTLLDEELKKTSSIPDAARCDETNIVCDGLVRKDSSRFFLSRRNSFPFINSGAEINLSTVEFLRSEQVDFSTTPYLKSRIGKCASFSNLEDFLHGSKELYSEEKASNDYITRVANILQLEHLKSSSTYDGNQAIAKRYKQMNFELVKLQNVHSQMEAKRSVIDSEYSNVLVGRMRDLADNIDRMAFRCRDLQKKINELDDNSRMFEYKVTHESVKRLDDVIDHLLRSTKFRRVFKDDEERQKLVFQLTGRNFELVEDTAKVSSYWGFRALIVFLYDMMVFVLQVFNFDRANMNLDRIRASYGKLDPNRRYINKAYSFVGRDLIDQLRSSTSSASTTEGI